jgi:hypothetical protein
MPKCKSIAFLFFVQLKQRELIEHRRKVKLSLSDDVGLFLTGRVSVAEWID